MISTRLEYKIENTRDNFKILRINKDNKWIYIGSKYNMKSEIEKFVDVFEENEIDDKQSVIIVFGFGTGEHISGLRSKYPNNEIIVFEPNLNLKEYIDEIDFIKKDNKLTVFCQDNIELKEMLGNKINRINYNYAKFIYFSNYYKIYNTEINEFLNQLKYIFYDIKLSLNTAMSLSERGFISLLKNIKYMAKGTPADLYKNEYKDKPCIIVSAGPSLEKNIEYLKNVNDDMIILSGGRTLRALIDKKIYPHLLAVVDSNEVSYKLCEGYIEKLNKPLLFFEESSEKVVANHKGEKIFFTYNDEIKKIAECDMEPLITGGSVAHVMTSYAVMLGCNPIIFIGQDLAYTGERSHAKIADNRDNLNWFERLKADDDIYVEDINGNKVRTSLTLYKYKETIEEIIKANNEITFINATEGGARIKGTIEMTLKEVIEKYKKEAFNIFEKKNYLVNIKKNIIQSLEKTSKGCSEIIKLYKEGLELLEKLKKYNKLKNSNYLNEILAKLDAIDEKSQKKYENMELIKSLIFPIIYEILSQKTMDVNDDNKDILVYEENKKFYMGLTEKLRYAKKCIDDTLEELKISG